MDEDHLRDLFPDDTYDKFRDIVLRVLEHVYGVAGDLHGRDSGLDSLTYGVTIWRLSWHHAERDLEAAGFRVERPKNSFRVVIGPFQIYLYRAGAGGDMDIATNLGFLSGTPTKEAISESNQLQLELGLELADEDEGDARRHPAPPLTLRQLVVAHTGNPTDGLSSVWIGAPHASDDGVRWSWLTNIYSTAPADLGLMPPPPPPVQDGDPATFVPFTDQPEPAVEFGPVVREPGAEGDVERS